jgi:serine/threonine protein kinase
VALKLISRHDADETQRAFFLREIDALQRLDHPNIVSLRDAGEDEEQDAFYLAMPWFEKNLSQELAEVEDLGWDDFADQWGVPLVDALAHAHELTSCTAMSSPRTF